MGEGNLLSVGDKSANVISNQSNVSHVTVKYNEKFALALEDVETKTGIKKYDFLTGQIKTTMKDIIDNQKKAT